MANESKHIVFILSNFKLHSQGLKKIITFMMALFVGTYLLIKYYKKYTDF